MMPLLAEDMHRFRVAADPPQPSAGFNPPPLVPAVTPPLASQHSSLNLEDELASVLPGQQEANGGGIGLEPLPDVL